VAFPILDRSPHGEHRVDFPDERTDVVDDFLQLSVFLRQVHSQLSVFVHLFRPQASPRFFTSSSLTLQPGCLSEGSGSRCLCVVHFSACYIYCGIFLCVVLQRHRHIVDGHSPSFITSVCVNGSLNCSFWALYCRMALTTTFST